MLTWQKKSMNTTNQKNNDVISISVNNNNNNNYVIAYCTTIEALEQKSFFWGVQNILCVSVFLYLKLGWPHPPHWDFPPQQPPPPPCMWHKQKQKGSEVSLPRGCPHFKFNYKLKGEPLPTKEMSNQPPRVFFIWNRCALYGIGVHYME